MSDKQTPKMELIVTLDKAWEISQSSKPVDRAILRALIDHARAVAKRVGNEARTPQKAKVAAS